MKPSSVSWARSTGRSRCCRLVVKCEMPTVAKVWPATRSGNSACCAESLSLAAMRQGRAHSLRDDERRRQAGGGQFDVAPQQVRLTPPLAAPLRTDKPAEYAGLAHNSSCLPARRRPRRASGASSASREHSSSSAGSSGDKRRHKRWHQTMSGNGLISSQIIVATARMQASMPRAPSHRARSVGERPEASRPPRCISPRSL